MESMDPTRDAAAVFVYRHEPLLGTVVEFRIRATDAEVADRADERMVEEFGRLSAVFSVHDEHSQLRRWQRGEGEPGPELAALLAESLQWQRRCAGAYNPAVGALTERWETAARLGVEPRTEELDELAASIASPPYRVAGDRVGIVGDVSTLSFNAFAKGRIVDLAADAGLGVDGIVGITVNAGGDLVHRGPVPISVGIEDPARPYDNVAPLTVVSLVDGGLATSGTVRRGVRVGGRWFGHVIDPRNGRPIERLPSVSVLAPDAATADVVATVIGVLGPAAGLEFAATVDGVGCLLVGDDGSLWDDPVWRSHERPGARRLRPS